MLGLVYNLEGLFDVLYSILHYNVKKIELLVSQIKALTNGDGEKNATVCTSNCNSTIILSVLILRQWAVSSR